MAAAVTVTFASGRSVGRIGIDTMVVTATGLTPGAWYDMAVARPSGIGGYRIQADATGTNVSYYVPQSLGAYTFTLYPTNWTTGQPSSGLPVATVTTTTFDVAAVAPDGGMAFPTATVSGVTVAATSISA